MNTPYQLKNLFPFIDLALLSEYNPDATHTELYGKAVWGSTNPNEALAKLQAAKVVFLHPDAFDYWSRILVDLQQRSALPVQLFLLADSDYTTGHQHLDPLLAAFPRTQFWVQNWFGYHERVSFLPIGVNKPCVSERQRYKPLGISFFLQYPGYIHREEFTEFLQTTPAVHRFCFPCLPYTEYCGLVSECFFTCCPMGGGYDTLRFWEALMMGTIPIVKKHPFYEVLRLYYPRLPFILLDDWNDLLTLDLTKEVYDSLMEKADLSCCGLSYWSTRLKQLLEDSSDSCGDLCGKTSVLLSSDNTEL